MGVESMGEQIYAHQSLVDVDFFGDLGNLSKFNKEELMNFVNRFVEKYGNKKEVFDVSVYLKRFEANYLGKPLIFCNLALNTQFGLVSATSTSWGLKQVLRDSKNALSEMRKLSEKEAYGIYTNLYDEAII